MLIKIDTSGLDAMKLEVAGLARKIPVATVAALNDAAYLGSQKTREAVASVFDRPTPWVKGSVKYWKATRASMRSSIDFTGDGNKTGVTVEQVLDAEIHGGKRRLKRHEKALNNAGGVAFKNNQWIRTRILPDGMSIVPGSAAKLDQFGNMSSQQIVQIISYFQGFEQVAGARQNMKDAGFKRLARDNKRTGAKGFVYFVLHSPRGKLLPGIYQRFETAFGSAVKPVMIFVRTTNYKKRLDFYGIAEKHATAEFERAFAGYVDKLLGERGL